MKFSMKFSAGMLALVLSAAFLSGCTSPKDQNKNLTLEYPKRTAPVVEKAEEAAPTATKFKVSHVFSKNMVLQRDEYIRIWGWASEDQEGKTVCAEFKGLKGSAVIQDGAWLIQLDGTLSASSEKGHTLRVYGDSYEKTYEDVLVGDVYMVIGQSNAAYTVGDALKDTESDEAYSKYFSKEDVTDDDNIRVIRNVMGDPTAKGEPSVTLSEDVNHSRGWQVPKKAYNNTSALGFFFAKQLSQATNNEIPIGIIESSAAGCVLAAFMSPEAAEACKVDGFNESKGGYYADSVLGLQRSRIVYNQYINPFMNFTISGMLWYQGESDAPESIRANYPENFKATIQDYRNKINQNFHDFPVYIVELPTIYTQPADYTKTDWQFIDTGGVRAYMGNIPSILNNSYIAPSSDLWKNTTFWNGLHPYCKWPMAERITKMVLAMFYPEYTADSLNAVTAPTFLKAEADSKKSVDLYFTSVGKGLKTSGGSDPKGFEVLVHDVWTAPEQVNLSGNQVTVKHKDEFTAVRYYGITSDVFPDQVNVCGDTGIPMLAFCYTMES